MILSNHLTLKTKNMNNLNKEGFWDPLSEIAPDAVEKFKKWVDEYKKEVNWGSLFPAGIKFHDLPIELQMGIVTRFDMEMKTPVEDCKDAIEAATNYFIKLLHSKMIIFQETLVARKGDLVEKINKEQGN